MSEATERLLVRIDATTEQLRRELKRADAAVKHSNTVIGRAVGSMGTSWNKADKFVRNHSRELKLMGVAAVGAVGLALKGIINYSDEYKQLQGQLKLVTDSQEELNQVWNRALALSNDTGASLDATINLYARMARSTEELGLSQNQLFTITEAINKSFVVSGASAQEAASATLQLSQGMAAGALRGEELNSVMENSPRLARALADGLGVSIGQLREMGAEGELTAEAVTGALLKMSDSINTEFDQMPMTVARSTNKIKNLMADAFGRADLDPLIASLEEFGDVVSDPAVVKGLTDIASGIVDISNAAIQAAAALPGLYRWIRDGNSDFEGLTNQIGALQSRLKDLTAAGKGQGAEAEGLRRTIAQLEKSLDALLKTMHPMVDATTELAEAAADEAAATEEAAAKYGELNEVIVEATRIKNDYDEKAKGVIAALQFESEQLERTGREQFIFNELQKAGIGTSDELQRQIRETAGALYDQEQALKAVKVEAKESGEAAKQAMSLWEEALQGTAERIDSAFAEAWKGAFDSFSDFAKGLKDAFRQLLGELAHMAITRPIIMKFAAAFGLGGGAGAASAAGGGISGGGVGLGALLGGGGLLSSLGSGYTAVGNYLGAGTFAGNAALETGRGYSYGSVGSGYANLGMNLGAGFLGGYAGNQVFGDTSGIGAFGGGAIGSIFGPIGTGIGAFIGTGIERGLGNVFGFGGKGGNQAGLSDFNLATGLNNAQGVGKSFDQANVDAAAGIVNVLQQFSNVIGGSDFSGRVKVGNTSGIKLNGQKYDSAEALFDDIFDDIIAGATNLDDAMRELLLGFEGTAQQTMEFAAAVISLDDAAGINSVTMAIEDFNREQPSVMEAYRDQTDHLKTLITNYDGSAAAATELNNALLTNKGAAYQMAIAIQAVGAELSKLSTDQAAYIRESVLTPMELRDQRKAERDELRAGLGALTNPAEIEATTRRILELNRQIYDSLPEELKLELAEPFALIAENTGINSQALMDKAVWEMQTTQEDMNVRIAALLDSSAAKQQQAADTSLQASETFAAWVNRLQKNGITVNINQPAISEVNV